MQWFNQLFRRAPQRIPDPLWDACVARLYFLEHHSPADRIKLKDLSEQFLATKAISGAGGLVLTDEIAVLIAIQASLPVLHLTLDLYDDLSGVVVYPSGFIVPQSEVDETGVVHEWREPVAGEAMALGGPVVLSWEDIEDGEEIGAGFNVLIHEFVHKIDMEHGDANGRPPFLASFHAALKAAEWKAAFSTAFADFSQRVDAIEEQLPDDVDFNDPVIADHYDALIATLPIDPYAATHPAEFFAVASEAFFINPAPLAADYPDIYRLLSLYYRQTPLAIG